MKGLTARQREVLDYVMRSIKENGDPPTIRELAAHFGISVKGAYDHVSALKAKGWLEAGRQSRTMHVVDPRAAAEMSDIWEVPVLGVVAAGEPISAVENRDGSIFLHPSMLRRGRDYFAVKVRGDSMIKAGIMDGDMAVLEQQDMARNGEIVVAMVDEAMTLKRYYKERYRIRLQPENDAYQPIFSRDVKVLGRLVHIIRSY
jgi:repressor LexA